jgi:amidohydrolase
MGPCLLLRAELDALPIQEVNDFSYRSHTEGVSHKCGHDGHTTILLGVAQALHQQPLRKGKVLLLFQPAEETGVGAKAMLEDPQWRDIPRPDYVFALHNLPGYPLGQVVIREGAITAAVRSMIIRLYGKTAHAAEPEHGINPAETLADILPALQLISNNQVNRTDFKVITPVHIVVGEKAYGVAAGYGELHLTIRTWTEEVMQELIAEIKQILAQAAQQKGIRYEIDWTDTFPGNTNHSEVTDALLRAAKGAGLQTKILNTPLKWGEDFGYFTQRYPGAFLGLGAGENSPALHNPDYDFPDVLIETGTALWEALLAVYKMR